MFMQKIYYLLILLLSFSVLCAQEKLSKEEKERREKNIQAGNPFAKFGYKAKVATLSKGKYLEVHDLDSIVIIGSTRWHVDKNKIVGDVAIDSLNPDARPIGDAVGRWINPDPLSEEFPSWSPYNFVLNNPLRLVDPDGRAPQDIIVLNNPNGAGGFGHMAMLVGDDKNGWTFISKEGRNKEPWYSNEVSGGPALKPLIKEFKTLEDFRNAQKDDKNLGGYTEDVRLNTTPEQDKKAKETTTDSAESWYSVLFANCADAVSDGLKSAGLDPGYNTTTFPGGDVDRTLEPQPNKRMDKVIDNNKKDIIPTDSVKRE
jgi:hypothetical protein